MAVAEAKAAPALTLIALAVVFGDIGTSPLYAVKQTFSPAYGIPLEPQNILGGLSALFWSVMAVVSLKYATLIMRADNKGEGGIMALVALALSSLRGEERRRSPVLFLGILGVAFFFSEAALAPALAVVAALEGLEVKGASSDSAVLGYAVLCLLGLFAMQSRRTTLASLFGPVAALWFVALMASGVTNILAYPAVLQALDPLHALRFATSHGLASFVVLGAVLLSFAGAEALHADMGRFGKKAIRLGWFAVVLPALIANYFGQGALLLANPNAIENPFYLAFPAWALQPMIVLATAVALVASQAMISRAYATARQAAQLGFLPRVNVIHNPGQQIGYYVPVVKWTLLVLVLGVVVTFGSSANLAAAYGVAVMGAMLATTLLTFFVIRFVWRYPLLLCVAATALFVSMDAVFFSSSLLRIAEGGWFPLLTAALAFFVMSTWRLARERADRKLQQDALPLQAFIESLLRHPPHRVPGTAVFLTATPDATPVALLHNLKHNGILHEQLVFLTVETLDVPTVERNERVVVEPIAHNAWRTTVRFGFKDSMDLPHTLRESRARAFKLEPMETSYFLSRETLAIREAGFLVDWRNRIFAAMARNAGSEADYLGLPANRVIVLGAHVEI